MTSTSRAPTCANVTVYGKSSPSRSIDGVRFKRQSCVGATVYTAGSFLPVLVPVGDGRPEKASGLAFLRDRWKNGLALGRKCLSPGPSNRRYRGAGGKNSRSP